MMAVRDSTAWLVASSLGLMGCAPKQVAGESGDMFGGGTAATRGEVTGADTEAEAEDDDTSAGSVTSDDGPATTSATSTTGAPPQTTGPSDTGTTGAGPGEGQLGECIGVGAWSSCAQYCEAVLEQCVPGGCDGVTVAYYGDVGACTAMRADGGEASACGEGFTMGGGISFARCCCG